MVNLVSGGCRPAPAYAAGRDRFVPAATRCRGVPPAVDQTSIIPRMFFSNFPFTVVTSRSLRFRLVVFLVRMWLCPEWPRSTLPLAVTLKRLRAPRWDFCLGTARISSGDGRSGALLGLAGLGYVRLGLGWLGRRGLRALARPRPLGRPGGSLGRPRRAVPRSRALRPLGRGRSLARGRKDLMHAVPRAFGRGFYHPDVLDVRLQALEQVVAEVHAGHLAAAELHRGLDLVPLAEEAQQALELHVVVVGVDHRPELDLLDLEDLLLLLGLLLLLLLLVEELPEVHHPADRGDGVGRHLHQVQATLVGDLLRLADVEHAELVSLVVDDPHLAGPDLPVHSRLLVDGQGVSSELGPADGRLRLQGPRPLAVLDPLGDGGDGQRAQVLARAQAHGGGAGLLLARAHHQHVRDLLLLGLADLVAQLLVALVELDPDAGRGELVAHPAAVVEELLRDRQHDGLRGGQPDREGASGVLDEDAQEPL